MRAALSPAKIVTIAATYLLLESGSELLVRVHALWRWTDGLATFPTASFTLTFALVAIFDAVVLAVALRLLLWPRPVVFRLAVAFLIVEVCATAAGWWLGSPPFRFAWPSALGRVFFVVFLLTELLRPSTRRYVITVAV